MMCPEKGAPERLYGACGLKDLAGHGRVSEKELISGRRRAAAKPRPGTRTADDDRVPAAVKKERSARLRALSTEACRRRWAEKLGREETVLVDRPGRGYGDDYSPWLVEGPQGEFVRVRAHDVTEEGILGLAA